MVTRNESPDSQRYRPVRALNRGLMLLQELNRIGSGRPSDLARAAGLDRTTTYRLLATLEDFGLVRTSISTDEYVLTEKVRTLSDGFTEPDRTLQIVSVHLGTLFQKVIWPTDFATFDRGAMMIRETTHRFSPYSVHRAIVGQPRPLLTSALGRAAFAGSSTQERTTLLEFVRVAHRHTTDAPRWIESQVDQLLAEYAKLGYSRSLGGADKKVRAIGLPVRTVTGSAAAINLVFFRSAMSFETAAERYLEHMQNCVANIEASLSANEAGLARHPIYDRALSA